MKKLLIISAVILGAVACTKNDINEIPDQEITFEVATYSGQTKGNTDYADNYAKIPFGTYAWFYQGDQDAQEFMVDEEVSLVGNAWKPSVTYYWPKTGHIDFISYSPKSISEFVTATPDTIKIGDEYVVEHLTKVDVMYADKAIEKTKNDSTYYYRGVPTLFRHALAKLNINIKTAYDKKVINENDSTEWAITVKELSLLDIYNTGSVELDLDDDNSWKLPDGAVWDNDGNLVDTTSFTIPTGGTKIDADGEFFAEDYFVLPQDLDGQTIEIIVDIETTLPNGMTIIEKGVKLKGSLKGTYYDEVKKEYVDAITAWQMNKDISYDITIIPASGEEPVAILFDPAVVDWEDATSADIPIKK